MNELQAIEIAQNAMGELIKKDPNLRLRYEVSAYIGLAVWRAMQAELKHVATVAEVYQSRYTLEWEDGGYCPEGTQLYAMPNAKLSVSQQREVKL